MFPTKEMTNVSDDKYANYPDLITIHCITSLCTSHENIQLLSIKKKNSYIFRMFHRDHYKTLCSALLLFLE